MEPGPWFSIAAKVLKTFSEDAFAKISALSSVAKPLLEIV